MEVYKRLLFSIVFVFITTICFGQKVQVKLKAMCHKNSSEYNFSDIKEINGTGWIEDDKITVFSNQTTTFYILDVQSMSDDKKKIVFRCQDNKGNKATLTLTWRNQESKMSMLLIQYDVLEVLYWFDIQD